MCYLNKENTFKITSSCSNISVSEQAPSVTYANSANFGG